MPAIPASLETRASSQLGYGHYLYTASLEANDTLEPILLPLGVDTIVARVRPSPTGAGEILQSWQRSDTETGDLVFTSWDIGQVSMAYVDQLVLSNWISASCSSGAIEVEILVVAQ